MPNLIKRSRKGRTQLILGFAFIFVLVLGLPLTEINNRSLADNTSITATVVVSATSRNTLLIPKDANGNPIVSPAILVVTVAEEVTFKAKGVPVGGAYWWSASPVGASNTQPFYWKLPANALSTSGPVNSDGESLITKRFAIPGIYRATVTYKHPQSVDVIGSVTVMVVDHTRVDFATNTYVRGTGNPWSETPTSYPAYTSNYDSDDDGLPDAWEITYFGNLSKSWGGDPDGDGISNARELAMNTNPGSLVDTDGDGLPDAWEQAYGLNSNASNSDNQGVTDNLEDPDGDGLTNAQEFAKGTNPWLMDTDGDGIPDGSDPQPLVPQISTIAATFRVLTVIE